MCLELKNPLFWKCKYCGEIYLYSEIEKNLFVCKNCGYHQPLTAENRIRYIVDENTFTEMEQNLVSVAPFEFPDYEKKLKNSHMTTNMLEAVVTGIAKIKGVEVFLGVMDSRFIMGSMGIAVGEKIARLFDCARKDNKPVILITASGGARMQEGVFSLFQMAKTSVAISQYKNSGGFFISVLTHPTTGGVSASFAFLGDIVIAEPRAMIGFAGKRIIEQTTNEIMPDNFQTAEFWLERGYLDMLVDRKDLKQILGKLLLMHA